MYDGNLIDSLIATVRRNESNPLPADDDEIMLERRLRMSSPLSLTVDDVLEQADKIRSRTIRRGAKLLAIALVLFGSYKWVNQPLPPFPGTMISTNYHDAREVR